VNCSLLPDAAKRNAGQVSEFYHLHLPIRLRYSKHGSQVIIEFFVNIFALLLGGSTVAIILVLTVRWLRDNYVVCFQVSAYIARGDFTQAWKANLRPSSDDPSIASRVRRLPLSGFNLVLCSPTSAQPSKLSFSGACALQLCCRLRFCWYVYRNHSSGTRKRLPWDGYSGRPKSRDPKCEICFWCPICQVLETERLCYIKNHKHGCPPSISISCAWIMDMSPILVPSIVACG
jgi:hypothetical protein